MDKKVTKAVIPVAGLGTRMLPATKAIPKEMLPIVDKPLIQYVVNEAAQSGIKDIIFVTHASKNAVENHFDHSFELESTLEKRVKRQQLNDIKSICPSDITIMHVRQGEAKGLAHAINRAKKLVKDEPFAIMLPDVLINQYRCNLQTDNLSAMIKRYHETGTSQIMVERIDPKYASEYGIIDVSDEIKCHISQMNEGEYFEIKGLVEKPKGTPPSNLAIVGRYIMTSDIWDYIDNTPLGFGDEIQLTDTIRLMLKDKKFEAYLIKGKSMDCGNKLGYVKTFIEYALNSNLFGADLKDYLINKLGL